MLTKMMAAAFVAGGIASAVLADEAMLDKPLPLGRHEEVGAHVVQKDAGCLRVTFEPGRPDALVRLKPAEGTWNLDGAAAVLVDVRNYGRKPAALLGRFDNAKWSGSAAVVPPGATETVWIYMKRDNPPKGFNERFSHMFGRPGGVMWLWSMPDPAKIHELTFLPVGDVPAEDIEISNVRVRPWNVPIGKAPSPLDDAIFPFVDQYGQYMHRQWPGKIHTDADLIAAREAEDADFKEHPGPADGGHVRRLGQGADVEGDGAFPYREGRRPVVAG